MKAIDVARGEARARAWELAGQLAPDHAVSVDRSLVIDVDATLVTGAFGQGAGEADVQEGLRVHPLRGFADQGPTGTGEPPAMSLRPGNAGSNTAADHVIVLR